MNRTTLGAFASLLGAVAAFVSCTSEVGVLGSTPDATAPDTPDAAPGVDADGGAVGDAGDNYLRVMQQRRSAASYSVEVGGGFGPQPAESLPTCTREVIGECEISSCTPGQPGKGRGQGLSAGTVTMTVEGRQPVTLEQGPGGYAGGFKGNRQVVAGLPISFTATGDELPAFEGVITMPGFPQVTPPPADGGAGTISVRADLLVPLSEPYTGEYVLTLSSTGSTLNVSGGCTFRATTPVRTVTFPAAVLARLPRELAYNMYALFLTRAVVSAGQDAVSLEAMNIVWGLDNSYTLVDAP